jgi:hypothetical protein
MVDPNLPSVHKAWTRLCLGITCFGLFLSLRGVFPIAGAVPVRPGEEEFRWSGDVPAGKSIEIKGVNGGIRAEQTSGNQVEVVATKSGHRSDPKSVKIKVVEHAHGVTICSVYPSSDSGQPNECQPGSGGRMNARNNDVKVDYVVRVPSGVGFVGRTVNGGIHADGLKGDVEGYSVNGGIQLSTSGLVQAKTVNGGINAMLGSTDWNGRLAFETVNGGIKVELPPNANTDFEAETVNGRVSSDFPITVVGKINPRKLSGTIGNGGRSLVMKTVNGSVALLRVP